MAGTICVRLPEDILKGLDDMASRSERTRSFFIRKAIEQYLSEYEDYIIAFERLHDKDDEILSSAELRRRLASKD